METISGAKMELVPTIALVQVLMKPVYLVTNQALFVQI